MESNASNSGLSSGYRASGPSCSRCRVTLVSLRDRLFGTDGKLLCASCYQDQRFEDLARARRQKVRRAQYATALTLGSSVGAALVLYRARSPSTLGAALLLLAVCHIIAEILAPRAFRWFTW